MAGICDVGSKRQSAGSSGGADSAGGMEIKLLDGKGGSFLGNDCKTFPDGGGKKGGGGGGHPEGGCGGGGGGNEGGDGGGVNYCYYHHVLVQVYLSIYWTYFWDNWQISVVCMPFSAVH